MLHNLVFNLDLILAVNIESTFGLKIKFKASLYIGVSMFIQSLISNSDSFIQLPLKRNSKPEDQWSYKRSPASRSQYNMFLKGYHLEVKNALKN